MKISKEKLQKALEIVKPGLASKELIAQTTSFAFMEGKVVTYNDEVSISHPVEGLDITGAVDAELFYKFLSKITEEDMDLTVEGNELQVITKKGKAGLSLESEIKLPVKQELSDKVKWYPLPQGFIDSIRFVIPASGTNLSEPLLTCVHVNKVGYVEASDGLRLARHGLSDELPINTFLIPAKSALEVTKLTPSPTRIAIEKGWVRFRTKFGTIISCRLFFEDKYKNMAPYLQSEGGKRITLPDKGLIEMLSRAMVFAKREHSYEEQVVITIKEQSLKMEAKADIGWFREEIPMSDYKGKPLRFAVPPYLLKDILSETRGCLILSDKIVFQGSDWNYVGALKILTEK